MTEQPLFFADTYALVEISKGSKAYSKYTNARLVTTKYNVAEMYYHLLSSFGIHVADTHLEELMHSTVPITSSTIRNGMLFRFLHKKEKLSYVDCIGYAKSIELGIPFLTGDQKFKDKVDVEFVK